MSEHGLAERVGQLRSGLSGLDPHGLADRTGSGFIPREPGQGAFHFNLWRQPALLTFPAFVALAKGGGSELPMHIQALVLYYFTTCDGEPASRRWISFSELPDGRFYNQAFQGYTGKPLAKAFGDRLAVFQKAAESLGGERVALGDCAFSFQALPHVPLLAAYWLGDEDFPPACQILFDAAVRHHLPTDACAILGSALAQKLLKGSREGASPG